MDLDADQGDTSPGVKVRVSKIKKVVIDDDDDDSEMPTETDLDAEEMEELNMEKRIKLATKKMEEMVKQQLRDSGVVPSGKAVLSLPSLPMFSVLFSCGLHPRKLIHRKKKKMRC